MEFFSILNKANSFLEYILKMPKERDKAHSFGLGLHDHSLHV